MAETIRETIEEWLKKQYDSDLLEFAQEQFDYNDHLSWSYHKPVENYLFERLETFWGCSIEDAQGILEEALDAKRGTEIGWEGDEWDEDEVLKDIKRYYLDELVDEIEDGMYNGTPDVYRSLDTDELVDMLAKCPEWDDEYGDRDED